MLSLALFLPLLLLSFYLVSYFTVAAHEYAHAVVAAWLHIPVHRVTLGRGPVLVRTENLVLKLFPFGGQIDLREDTPTGVVVITERQLGKVAIAGPAANLLTSLCAACLTPTQPVASLGWSGLAFATLFNILCFFQNALAVEGTDGYLFWNYVSQACCKDALSPWAAHAINRAGDVLFHVALGSYMGWMVWRAGVLNPWLAG